MKSLLSMAGFLSASAAVHVAALLHVAGPGPGGGEEPPAGADVTLAAAAPGLATLIAGWERPPVAGTAGPGKVPVPVAPAASAVRPADMSQTRHVPSVPAALPAPGGADARIAPGRSPAAVLAQPPVPAMAPAAIATAQAGDAPPAISVPAPARPPGRIAPAAAVPGGSVARPPAVESTAPEPPTMRKAMPRPAAPAKPGASGSDARPASADTAAAAPAAPGPRQADLLADWGGKIRTRIAREKRYPAGTRAEGEALLRIDVGTDGRLRAVELARSAGDPRLDRAALAAVRGARLPRAPNALAAGVRRFNLPMRFER